MATVASTFPKSAAPESFRVDQSAWFVGISPAGIVWNCYPEPDETCERWAQRKREMTIGLEAVRRGTERKGKP